ncbi:hypothetical protein OLMES_3184 [Oleiphilus messinensis]|uniref:Uncharacterized protein n=1 Tax=Oleiphilus messinensis TaxID=141451 RepID=A0A1Y0IBT4_9GAMM|nr:hypothetical protein [Oleiphilus messinensis]ARU57226.1 hypothetical protein OLMES_3184 [Oleiphilus messinensis]
MISKHHAFLSIAKVVILASIWPTTGHTNAEAGGSELDLPLTMTQWQKVTTPEFNPNEDITDLALGNGEPPVIYITTREVNITQSIHLYQSPDFGLTWTELQLPDHNTYDTFYLDPSDSNSIYTVVCGSWTGQGRLYRNDLEAQTRERIIVRIGQGEDDSSACPQLYFDPSTPEMVFLTDRFYHYNWVYYSPDQGKSWHVLDNGSYVGTDYPLFDPFRPDQIVVIDSDSVRYRKFTDKFTGELEDIARFNSAVGLEFESANLKFTTTPNGIIKTSGWADLYENKSKQDLSWQPVPLPREVGKIVDLLSWPEKFSGIVVSTDTGVWGTQDTSSQWFRLGDDDKVFNKIMSRGTRLFAVHENQREIFVIE